MKPLTILIATYLTGFISGFTSGDFVTHKGPKVVQLNENQTMTLSSGNTVTLVKVDGKWCVVESK